MQSKAAKVKRFVDTVRAEIALAISAGSLPKEPKYRVRRNRAGSIAVYVFDTGYELEPEPIVGYIEGIVVEIIKDQNLTEDVICSVTSFPDTPWIFKNKR